MKSVADVSVMESSTASVTISVMPSVLPPTYKFSKVSNRY